MAPRRPRDDGVSTVVGAILTLSILVSLLVTVRVSYVPAWQSDAEADHARLVTRQLTELQGTLTGYAALPDARDAIHVLTLGMPRPSLFQSADPADAVHVHPEAEPILVTAKKAVVHSADGKAEVEVREAWKRLTARDRVDGILEVYNLRLRYDNLHKALLGRNTTLTFLDPTGAFAGSYVLRIEDISGTDWQVIHTVRDATGEVINEVHESYFNNQRLAPYWSDVLDPRLRFDRVLAAAPTPTTLFLNGTLVPGNYTMSYEALAANGQTMIVGGGLREIKDYEATHPAGRLVYETRNQHHVDQELLLEHGAILLVQGDDALVRVPPALRAARAGADLLLDWTLPAIQAPAQAVQGTGTVAVHARADQHRHERLHGPQFEIEIPTAYPAAWAREWHRILQAGGLDPDASPPHYQLVSTADALRVRLYGLDGPGPAGDDDVQLTLRRAITGIQLIP